MNEWIVVVVVVVVVVVAVVVLVAGLLYLPNMLNRELPSNSNGGCVFFVATNPCFSNYITCDEKMAWNAFLLVLEQTSRHLVFRVHGTVPIGTETHTYMCMYVYIQGVTGGTDQTSGECSLGQTIPI